MTDFEVSRQIPMAASPGTARGWRCPDPSLLAAYSESKLDATERVQLERHLADCDFCLGQVGFLVRDIQEEIPAVPGRLLDAVRGGGARWFHPVPNPVLAILGLAAALILIGTVVLQQGKVLAPTTETQVERTVRNGLTIRAAPRIVVPEEGALISKLPAEVRWEPAPGALHYTILLVNLDGDVVWEERSSGDHSLIPAEVKLETGQRYFLWVEAHLDSGSTQKSSAVGFSVPLQD